MPVGLPVSAQFVASHIYILHAFYGMLINRCAGRQPVRMPDLNKQMPHPVYVFKGCTGLQIK